MAANEKGCTDVRTPGVHAGERDSEAGVLVTGTERPAPTPPSLEPFASLVAYDPETGALSRGHFETLAASEWERALRARRELSFILLRLPAVGTSASASTSSTQAMLRGTIVAIRSVLRSGGDAVGRLDALDFAVLLPETGSGGTRDVVGRLLPAIEQQLNQAAEASGEPMAVDLCSVTLSRHSVGERGWQGALDAARNLLDTQRTSPDSRVLHLDILAALRGTVC